ncbi:uncharacterized protein LOC128662520 [Bombina bombina]|uniref:uncharacterized protein LOC128662520 n=1 Tax=Bombina bombina TaxID=8345 RepID=UPI00235AB7BA|nr:uncharacterized protein LOC128662520 [Bombina bombina]
MNCKNPTEMTSVREALAESITAVSKDEKDDSLPEICQMVMDQIADLCKKRIRFLRWTDFMKRISDAIRRPLCTVTLLTAVEYLHNLSELLYLPCGSLSDSRPAVHTEPTISTYTCPNTSSGPCSCGAQTPSGLVVLDMNWLLQEIFGRFGNFCLSPASGRNKERWSFLEMQSALELTEEEGDTEDVLDMLGQLELLYCTKDGEYLVPAWLRSGGPADQKVGEKARGVAYHWQEASRGIFSHSFVGRLQIRLLHIFKPERCSLWREVVWCVSRAVLRAETSADKRSLYLIGGWSEQSAERDCYQLLDRVGKEVEKLLSESQEKGWEKLHLSPRELFNWNAVTVIGKTEELSGFSWEQILKAERETTKLCGRNGEDEPWEVLFPQHDTRMLQSLRYDCSTRWLQEDTLEQICASLDIQHPTCQDWQKLAEKLGGDNTWYTLEQVKENAKLKGLSPTCLVIQRHPVCVKQLLRTLHEMGREDCTSMIENMIGNLCDTCE